MHRRNLLLAAAGALAAANSRGATPEETARNEDFWREIQLAFNLNRNIIDLNCAGVCAAPRSVMEAQARHQQFANASPVYHMWRLLEPESESIRKRLAETFGCDPEELALTRNATEALEICQLGIDLKPGDEVLTTDQDYPRMIETWQQRQRREGIVLKTIPFPVPPPSLDDLYNRIEAAITPRTRVILVCHVTYTTGQIFPVKRICALARKREIECIVDGAHAFAHFPFKLADLDCDYYGASLHKWLLGPHGTGFLFVRKTKIAGLWPLQPAHDDLRANIRKFEQIGTHSAAPHNSLSEALLFHEAIGTARKAARLRYLRDRWANRLSKLPGARLLTNLDPAQSCGIAVISFEGRDHTKLTTQLWDRRRIQVTNMTRDDFQGLRISPNIYTTISEIDIFCDVLEDILAKS